MHIAGGAYRALCCIGQVLFALNRRYLIHEKGALAEAATLPCSLPDPAHRIGQIWAAIGHADGARALADLRTLDIELRALVQTTA